MKDRDDSMPPEAAPAPVPAGPPPPLGALSFGPLPLPPPPGGAAAGRIGGGGSSLDAGAPDPGEAAEWATASPLPVIPPNLPPVPAEMLPLVLAQQQQMEAEIRRHQERMDLLRRGINPATAGGGATAPAGEEEPEDGAPAGPAGKAAPATPLDDATKAEFMVFLEGRDYSRSTANAIVSRVSGVLKSLAKAGRSPRSGPAVRLTLSEYNEANQPSYLVAWRWWRTFCEETGRPLPGSADVPGSGGGGGGPAAAKIPDCLARGLRGLLLIDPKQLRLPQVYPLTWGEMDESPQRGSDPLAAAFFADVGALLRVSFVRSYLPIPRDVLADLKAWASPMGARIPPTCPLVPAQRGVFTAMPMGIAEMEEAIRVAKKLGRR